MYEKTKTPSCLPTNNPKTIPNGTLSNNDDRVNPSKETPAIAEKAAKIGSKVLWLQYGIHNEEAKKISDDSNIKYVSDKCIKQEYQKIFQKSHPVFPVLRNE